MSYVRVYVDRDQRRSWEARFLQGSELEPICTESNDILMRLGVGWGGWDSWQWIGGGVVTQCSLKFLFALNFSNLKTTQLSTVHVHEV